ncbi:MAG: M23 family metallopeptidase [Propionibacteriaceae bacterium]|nr:M23 family metallopeptidase [Propionibacteriaceae bacterium]
MQLPPVNASADVGSKYWPVIGPVIRPFNKPTQAWSAGHRGIDIAATAGTPIVAAASGYISWTGVVAGVASITITHYDGLRTSYLPVASSVTKGQTVVAGEIIGVLLAGHTDTADALHLGLRRGDEYLDPLAWLASSLARAAGPIRLLPEGVQVPTTPSLGAVSPAESNWPVTGPITSPYGWRPWGDETRFHSGVDIGVPCGTPVATPWPGQVVSVAYNWSLGNYMVVQHPGGIRSTFAHLSEHLAREGTYVEAREVIALSGTTGESTGCHLHWATSRDGTSLDPMSLV